MENLVTAVLILVALLGLYFVFGSKSERVSGLPPTGSFRYQPSQLAYSSVTAAHDHALRSRLRDTSGMTMSDYSLENNMLNKI